MVRLDFGRARIGRFTAFRPWPGPTAAEESRWNAAG